MTNTLREDPAVPSAERAAAVDPLADWSAGLAVFMAVPGINVLLAPDTPRFTILAGSEAFFRKAMVTPEEAVGRSFFEVLPDANPENRRRTGPDNLRRSLDRVIATRKSDAIDVQRYDLRRQDGTWQLHYWDPCNAPVLDERGDVRFLVLHLEDVTRRVLTDEAAETTARRAQQILTQMGDALIVLDRDYRIVEMNPAGERILGTPRDHLIGRSHWEAFPGSVGTEPERQYRRVREQGGEAHFRHFYTDETRAFHAEVDAYRTEDEGLAIFWRDVTANVQAEEKLRSSETRYRTLFDSIDEGFCIIEVIFDAEGRPTDYCFREANPAFVLQTGLTDVVGKCMKSLHPSQEDYWFEIYGKVATTGEPIRFVAPAAALQRVFDVYAFRIGSAVDCCVAVIFSDVTAERQVQAEREQLLTERQRLLAAAQAERDAATAARAEAEAANKAKSEFLAVMSHELRTPLNAIGGYTELIELGIHGPVTDAQQTALARIQQSQRHLLGLISGVLDYSRVEAGVARYRIESVLVSDAVAEAEVLVAPQMRLKELSYAWLGAPADVRVRADREKLQQILLNLLSNAVKFTNPRGTVPGLIEVSCTADGAPGDGRVAIHVRDTGEGIAADKLEQVFEPFVQVDQRLTRPHVGVGLGLAISRDLAHGMDGELTAESTRRSGSRFTLTLPRA